jgi:beta-mannosidase
MKTLLYTALLLAAQLLPIVNIEANLSNPLLMNKKLNAGWQFRQVDKDQWHPASVPGTVNTDLLKNKLINDPFYGDEETKQQWIGDEAWEYKTVFVVDATTLAKERVELVFNGLDTYADVTLNGKLILQANNMFRTWRVDVKLLLKSGKNELAIIFKSAYKEGLKELKQFPIQLVNDNDRGEFKTSVFTRKAQHHYGWDWGARFLTAGIWRPIELQAWDKVRINNIQYKQKSQSSVEAVVDVVFNLTSTSNQKVKLSVAGAKGKIYATKEVSLVEGDNRIAIPISISNPKLWWPNGLGDAYLYKLTAAVKTADSRSISNTQEIGIRTVEVVQQPDAKGKSFMFKVNGVPVFMKGANYIPLDHFLPRVDSLHYAKLVKQAKDANMNMLRVWGGGVYEDDLFYNECDRQGILVWQDFMFACGLYPWTDSFLSNIREEFHQNVIRLRNHPSIALWCGNNEVSEAWHNWGYQKKYKWSASDSAAIWNGYLTIFEKIIPDVLKDEDGSRFYWPSSPLYGWASKRSLTEGDSHYWGVWWGMEPFETYEKKVPRFASEYGFQSVPSAKTLEEFIPRSEWNTKSAILRVHQKHAKGFETIDAYLKRDLPEPKSFDDYIYLSQVLQGNGITLGIEAQRRSMPYCMGSLYWQLNDCWPVVSWSSIDYRLRPKALQHMAQHVFAPLLISFATNGDDLDIYLVNDLLKAQKGTLSYHLFNLSGKELWSNSISAAVNATSSAKVLTLDKSKLLSYGDSSSLALVVRFNGAESVHYFAKVKSLKFEKPDLSITLGVDGKGQYLTVTSRNVVKNLFIDSKHDLDLSQNFFDVVPGSPVKVRIGSKTKISLKDITTKSMYDCMPR